MRAIGIKDFIAKQFNMYPFDGIWRAHIGTPECNFKAIIFGNPGNGKIIFGNKESLKEMELRLSKRASAQVVVIDSRDYMNITTDQFKRLIDKYPHKAFILLCWSASGKPKGEYAKAIEYMCDIKVHVVNFVAYPRSRFGGNEKFVIWEKSPSPGQQLTL